MTVSDPQRPQRVYAAGEGGVFRSDDGGQSWQTASEGIEPPTAQAIALDPGQPHHLYLAASSGALYVSDDGATAWRLAAGPSAGGQ